MGARHVIKVEKIVIFRRFSVSRHVVINHEIHDRSRITHKSPESSNPSFMIDQAKNRVS